MSESLQQRTQPALKRPRPVLSCLECRRKKLKCDRLLPCQQCLKLNQPSSCSYAPGQEPEHRSQAQIPENTPGRSRSGTATEFGPKGTEQIDELNERVKKLEEALRQQTRDGRGSTEPPTVNEQPPTTNDDPMVFHKFDGVRSFIDKLRRHFYRREVQCLSSDLLAINQAVTIPQPNKVTSLTTIGDLSNVLHHLVQLLPPAHTCGTLINLYFENFEHCARILHKPGFMLDHRSYKSRTMDQAKLEYFLPILVGVLCTASNLNTYPECDVPALQSSIGIQGPFDLLCCWYELIVERDGPTLPAIQARLIALQAQRHQQLDIRGLWVSSAQLTRHAMLHGLHQAPSQLMNNFEAEMRRGIWLTILEQDLALSIACEMPPSCPKYDLKPPTNCDDDELSEESTADPPEHPLHRWTDGLCQNVLGTTFNQRLEAYQHRFAPKSSTHYSGMVEHVKKLESILRAMPAQFRLDDAASTPGRLMAQMDLDLTLRRSLIAACAPYARATPTDKVYREIRIPWVQSNLVVMCFQDLFDPLYPSIDVPRPIGYWDFFHKAYRSDVLQSIEAMFFEAHYLQQGGSTERSRAAAWEDGTGEASVTRFKRWDFAAMMKSLEDSLGPMSRRIGSSGEDLRTIVQYMLLWNSLRSPSPEEMDEHILDGLQKLATTLRRRLEREGFAIEPSMDVDSGSSEWLVHFLSPDK